MLTVLAQDQGERSLKTAVNVTIHILDKNDNQPLFYGYDRLLQQNGLHMMPLYSSFLPSSRVGAGVQVAKVFANDSDDIASGNREVIFKLLDHSNIFYVHPETGDVTTLVPIGG